VFRYCETHLQSSEAENKILPVTLKPMLLTGEPLCSLMHLEIAKSDDDVGSDKNK
jgi:hypothetical protein